MNTQPVFAVVGHPNKGKSSIVATLAQDDSVGISTTPGTTVRCRRFPMRVDGRTLYILVDTPGFQRSRAALEWMKARKAGAAERPTVVRNFVEVHRDAQQFRDECELLSPLIEGAGILYVTDGSRPFGQEYEAEMEILRWTGSPSMALINPIGNEDHVEEWTIALRQYFKIVRVFNAVTAEFDKRIQLLKAFGELQEDWRRPIEVAVESLEHDRTQRIARSAQAIADMLVDVLTLTQTKRLPPHKNVEPEKAALMDRYLDRLRKREAACRKSVEHIYDHHKISRNETALKVIDDDLFSDQSLQLWGLTRGQLVSAGAASGSIIGGGIDIALGGASLLLGAAIGGLVGGVSSWLSFGQMMDVKVLGISLGEKELQVGPVKNINLPYVILGRALYHFALIAGRTHALRGDLNMEAVGQDFGAQSLTTEQRRELASVFKSLQDAADSSSSSAARDNLTSVLDEILRERDQGHNSVSSPV